MISHNLKKETRTLEERGIPHDSFFTATFKDDSIASEKEANWSEFSEVKIVDYFDGKKTVYLSKHPIKHIHIKHGSLEHSIKDISKDVQVYQAIRSETLFNPGQEKRVRVLGRVVGLVKDGKVIEEYFLNEVNNEVRGMKA